jgi:hypothetical protein
MARRCTRVVTALALKNNETWILRIPAQIDKCWERDCNMQDVVLTACCALEYIISPALSAFEWSIFLMSALKYFTLGLD